MGDAMDALPSSETLDLDIFSEVRALSEALESSRQGLGLCNSDNEQLFIDCASHVKRQSEQIVLELSDVRSLAVEDYDTYLEGLKQKVEAKKADRARGFEEIEALKTVVLEKHNQLERDLEVIQLTLNFVESQGMEREKGVASEDCSTHKENHVKAMNLQDAQKFQVLKLHHQFEENQMRLKSLQDLEWIFKTCEAIEEFDHALTGLKVIEFEGNCIRLSLRTYITDLESLLHEQKIHNVIVPSEVNHEVLIEVMNGTMELKKVEIFPNDVYIGEIIDATKSFRTIIAHSSLLEPRSSLVWLLRKVQDRIILCTLRQSVVKAANNLRHSFEYLDRDEMIVAHMSGGVDAVIKIDPSWPVSNSVLRLMSLKSSDHHQSMRISLSVFCKVEEIANSLDLRVRQSISSFANAIEEILKQQMRLEIHSGNKHAE